MARLFVFALSLLSSFGVMSTPDITYLVYKEGVGLYQSSDLTPSASSRIGFINEVVAEIFKDVDVNVNASVMPSLRALKIIAHPGDTNWLAWSFNKATLVSIKRVYVDSKNTAQSHLPLARYNFGLFAVGDQGLKAIKPKDLKGKKVIMMSSIRYTAFDDAYGDSGFERVETTQYTYAIKMLLAGRADYLLIGDAAMRWNTEKAGEDFTAFSMLTLPDLNQADNTVSLVWNSHIPFRIQEHMRLKLKALEESGWLDDLRSVYGLSKP